MIKCRVEAWGGGMESIYREQSTLRVEQLVRGRRGQGTKSEPVRRALIGGVGGRVEVRPTIQKPEASTATHVLQTPVDGNFLEKCRRHGVGEKQGYRAKDWVDWLLHRANVWKGPFDRRVES